MALIIRIAINAKEIRCYGVRRVSHTHLLKPIGELCQYVITECYSHKVVGNVVHFYDDPPEELVKRAMEEILRVK